MQLDLDFTAAPAPKPEPAPRKPAERAWDAESGKMLPPDTPWWHPPPPFTTWQRRWDFMRTKGEVLDLIDALFPKFEDATRLSKNQKYPYSHIHYTATNTMREFLHWLTDSKPRIYKRARRELYQRAADRFSELIKENQREWNHSLDMERWKEEFDQKKAAQEMKGDGQGI
jgi:hypothetical protein